MALTSLTRMAKKGLAATIAVGVTTTAKEPMPTAMRRPTTVAASTLATAVLGLTAFNPASDLAGPPTPVEARWLAQASAAWPAPSNPGSPTRANLGRPDQASAG